MSHPYDVMRFSTWHACHPVGGLNIYSSALNEHASNEHASLCCAMLCCAGPHTMIITPNARISGAGFERWGARNVAGHYSVHYHLAGETTNAFVKNCAIYK